MKNVVSMLMALVAMGLLTLHCGGGSCDDPNPNYDASDPTSEPCLDSVVEAGGEAAEEEGGEAVEEEGGEAAEEEGGEAVEEEGGEAVEEKGGEAVEEEGGEAVEEEGGEAVEEEGGEAVEEEGGETVEEEGGEAAEEGDEADEEEGGNDNFGCYSGPPDHLCDCEVAEEDCVSPSIWTEECACVGTVESPEGGEASEEVYPDCSEKSLEDLKKNLLHTFSEHVVEPTYALFYAAASELASATALWASSLEDTHREAARQAWLNTITIWQRAEMFQVGPVASDFTPGGKDLREMIHSFPITNGCLIDKMTVEGDFNLIEEMQSAWMVNQKGLDALDKLLFTDTTENECPSNASLNTDGTWDSFSSEELMAARAMYAEALSSLIVMRANELEEEWNAFSPHLTSPGGENPLFKNVQSALNAVSDSFFYVESMLINMKLETPMGIQGCGSTTCPEKEEVPFSRQSLNMVRENMVGLRMALIGVSAELMTCATIGWVDLLAAVGAEDTASELIARIDTSIASIDAVMATTNSFSISQILSQSSLMSQEGLYVVYANIQAVAMLLKTDFATILNLELPLASAGDND